MNSRPLSSAFIPIGICRPCKGVDHLAPARDFVERTRATNAVPPAEHQIDHKTAERWLQILENLYVCFRVSPYGPPRVRAVKKKRNTDKREVDFVVLKDGKPVFAVECKSGEKAIGSALRYFAERTPIPASTRPTSASGTIRPAR